MSKKIKQNASPLIEKHLLPDGTLDYERITINNNCIQKAYHDNGKVRYEVPIKDGKRQGKFKCWDKEGNLKIESNYSKGNERGVRKVYADNGKLLLRQEILNGKEHGITTKFSQIGEEIVVGSWYSWHGTPVHFNPKQARLMADFLATKMNYKLESKNKHKKFDS